MAKKEITFVILLHSGHKVEIITVGGNPLMDLIKFRPADMPLPKPNQSIAIVFDTSRTFAAIDFLDIKNLACPIFKDKVKKVLSGHCETMSKKQADLGKPPSGAMSSSIFQKDINGNPIHPCAEALKKVQSTMANLGPPTLRGYKVHSLEAYFAQQEEEEEEYEEEEECPPQKKPTTLLEILEQQILKSKKNLSQLPQPNTFN